jgi:hypothetical protein
MTSLRAMASEAFDRRTALFVRMWAIAHIIHLSAASGSRLHSVWSIATVVLAILVIRSPGQGRLVALLAVAQLADMVAELPFSPDHWMLASAVNLAILATMAAKRSTGPRSLEAALPAARVVLLVAYSAAALSKYNTTFLDPVLSCATAIADTASFGLARDAPVGGLFAYATIACETSIPLLLAFRATRRHGVRLALMFHFMLSASPSFAVVDFTATLFALFLLFLSREEAEAVLDRISAIAGRSAIARDVRRAPWVAMAVALVAYGFLGYVQERVAGGATLVVTELYLVGILLVVVSLWPRPAPAQSFGRPSWAVLPVVLALLVWAGSPYLGLRTTGVFTMFSSLRTEGPAPNHLFMPALRLTDWQDELVVVESSNAEQLRGLPAGVVGVPLLALRQMAATDPDLVVSGVLDGRHVTYGPGAGQTALQPPPWWQQKLLLFRPVSVSGVPFCSNS